MRLLVLIPLLLTCVLAVAQDEPAASVPEGAAPALSDETAGANEPVSPQLQYRTGDIDLPSGVATLSLGQHHRYLDPQETSKLLVLWGNPPDESTDGAVLPADVDPLSQNGWAVILTYTDDGHVSDEDAVKIDYDELLEQMQKETLEANEWREEEGYGQVELLGWATRPSYDGGAKKLLWAKELRFDGRAATTLNYDVRVLGREGVLSMNAVAATAQLAEIEQQMQELLPLANFKAGQRYADFDSSTDRTAGYGIAALVAGGLAAKTGLLAKIGVLLAKSWKLIAVLVVGIAAVVRKVLARSKPAIGQ